MVHCYLQHSDYASKQSLQNIPGNDESTEPKVVSECSFASGWSTTVACSKGLIGSKERLLLGTVGAQLVRYLITNITSRLMYMLCVV